MSLSARRVRRVAVVPGFIDYARERTMTATPDAAYLSLGEKGNQDAQPHDAARARRYARDGRAVYRA